MSIGKLLIEKGADLHAKDLIGFQALHAAVQNGNQK